MGFAPKSGGEVPAYRFVPTKPKVVNLTDSTIDSIKRMAHDFWKRVANDKRISDDFKEFFGQGNPVELM
jgi:hypothetical protein